MISPGMGHNGGPRFETLEDMLVAVADSVRPPERITVSEAAERYHIVKNPGQHSGPFSLKKTPYLREPMDTLTSLDYTGVIFVGPARTGKSAMAINWLCHTAITDPVDMMIVHMAQHTARDWSKSDLAKAIRNSPELKKRLAPSKADDNTYDKQFLAGNRLIITWPTITNLSGKTIQRNFVMDLDRIKPQIVDKEGHVYDLTRKRADTFKRYGMTAAEASPGFPVQDPKWTPSPERPHEAPPAEGILSLYNRGDRRRWYWQCHDCRGTFQPRFDLLRWPNSKDHMECAEQAYLQCPKCGDKDGTYISMRQQSEYNNEARWVKEGQIWLPEKQFLLAGEPRRSDIASFWMFGPAAGFADWKTLVLRYLTACETYEQTGDDGPLMTTVTVDQGEGYVPKALQGGLLPETLKGRAEDWGGHDSDGVPYVPSAMRDGGFLLSTVDVQAGGRPSFVVHTFAITPVFKSPLGADVEALTSFAGFDIWHVDMFKILKSTRLDPETGERHDLDPAAYPEDWDVLIDQVMKKTYPLPDGTGRRMGVKLTVCDSGGKDGVTRNAYEFYRRLRNSGEASRFHLVKGSPSRTETATIRMTMPDAQHKDKMSIARGDVPVWLINSNIVKDTASNMMLRGEPGGMVHYPTWAPGWLYSQLTTEIRLPEGWKNPNNKRNEAFDLLAYCIAALDMPDIRIRFLDWFNPPEFALPWDRNPFVVGTGEQPFAAEMQPVKKTLADLARELG